MTKSAVVVPTNRPERIAQFIEAWKWQFLNPDIRWIIVEDSPYRTFKPPSSVEHYSHREIGEQLGDKAECIPTKSGGCRDFGFWLAGKDTSIDMIVSLDDDVLPIEGVNLLAEHWKALETPHSLKWWPLFPGFRLRGEPYGDEKVKTMLNLGLWHGFPDVDAYGQLCDPECEKTFGRYDAVQDPRPIPVGYNAPLCGMNVAFRREVAPYYYFPRLPDGYKRFDDIWAGLVFKRIADLHGWGVSYGLPAVWHNRASVALNNLRQEMLGYGLHEEVWKALDRCPDFSRMSVWHCYTALVHNLGEEFHPLRQTARHAEMWASLWPQQRR